MHRENRLNRKSPIIPGSKRMKPGMKVHHKGNPVPIGTTVCFIP
jgi:hypothetical protein